MAIVHSTPLRAAATLRPAVGYIRMSTDKQEDSPARQRQDILVLSERLGYQIQRWYEDHGLTGTESRNRQDLQKLLQDSRDGKLGQAVLLSEQSRMSREDIFDVMRTEAAGDAGIPIVTRQRGTPSFDNLGGLLTAIVISTARGTIKPADRVVLAAALLRNGQRQAAGSASTAIRDEAGRASSRRRGLKPPTGRRGSSSRGPSSVRSCSTAWPMAELHRSRRI